MCRYLFPYYLALPTSACVDRSDYDNKACMYSVLGFPASLWIFLGVFLAFGAFGWQWMLFGRGVGGAN
jgi:hypothetical protein